MNISKNNLKIEFDARSQNEALARVVIAAFLAEVDPTLEEINDIKTAVSEAVTNSIIHGYEEEDGKVQMSCSLISRKYEDGKDCNEKWNDYWIKISVKDEGVGIENIEKAKEPLFTTKADEERSGMGFMFMEIFMDKVDVISEPGKGTEVIMEKKINRINKQG